MAAIAKQLGDHEISIRDITITIVPWGDHRAAIWIGDVPSVSEAKLAAVHRELGRVCSGNALITPRGVQALSRYHGKQRTPARGRS